MPNFEIPNILEPNTKADSEVVNENFGAIASEISLHSDAISDNTSNIANIIATKPNVSDIGDYVTGMFCNYISTSSFKVDSGYTKDDTNTKVLRYNFSYTKNINTSFAEGDGQGCLLGGTAQPNTTYYIYVITKLDGSSDILTSLSVPTTLPSPFIYKQQIGQFKTDANSNIISNTMSSNSLEFFNQGASAFVPVGTVLYFPTQTIPRLFIPCIGANLSRTSYRRLFQVLGTDYGVGDGTSTFGTPDLRGVFLRGYDSGRGLDSGRVLGSYQDDAFQGHFHNTLASVNDGGGGYYDRGASLYGYNTNTPMATTPTSDGVNGTPRVSYETRPKNVAMVACMRY